MRMRIDKEDSKSSLLCRGVLRLRRFGRLAWLEEEEVDESVGLTTHDKTNTRLHELSFEGIAAIAVVEETHIACAVGVETIFQGDVSITDSASGH